MRGKGYGWVDFKDDDGFVESRKLSSKQREEVLVSYIRRRSGRRFIVPAAKQNICSVPRSVLLR